MRCTVALSLVIPVVAWAEDDEKITIGGYVEAFYQAHVQNPDNRITNLRGFDNRSRTFTLSNIAVDAKGEKGPIGVHIVLQIGATPTAYYGAEQDWKYIQAATVTGRASHDFVIEAGLFPSSIGPEVIPIKDNWNWSRSNLFFGLPAYHTGATVAHEIADGWIGKLHVYNGWNSVVDNNGYPSVAVSAAYTGPKTTAQLMYFGGIERPTGAPEGKAWRHLFDALAQYAITDDVSVMGHADTGFEKNDTGTTSWIAAAAYAKVTLSRDLYAAARGDYFYEDPGGGAIFWPTKWMASGTLTLAYQPAANVSIRGELRHDQAKTDVFFGGEVATDPMTMTAIANRKQQDTATLGVVAWF